MRGRKRGVPKMGTEIESKVGTILEPNWNSFGPKMGTGSVPILGTESVPVFEPELNQIGSKTVPISSAETVQKMGTALE